MWMCAISCVRVYVFRNANTLIHHDHHVLRTVCPLFFFFFSLLTHTHKLGKSLPNDVTNDMLEDESFLKNLHHVLLEVHVEQGALICPESGRRYAIKKGIVNMLLMEDEC